MLNTAIRRTGEEHPMIYNRLLISMVALILLLVFTANRTYAQENACLACHSGSAPDSLRAQTLVNTADLSASAHAGLTCGDCHDIQSDKPHEGRRQVDCGKCHADVKAQYSESVHGVAVAHGIEEAPRCIDCHGGHDIRKVTDPESRVFSTNVAKTCSDCHASEVIVGKFGLKPDRVATFKDSFHGVAVELGDTRAANCASCHGVHGIFPQDDPRSTINPANISKTCGQCHDDLPEEFTHGTFHVSASDKSSGGLWYVRQFYIWFISIIIVLFITYRVLEYKRRVRRID